MRLSQNRAHDRGDDFTHTGSGLLLLEQFVGLRPQRLSQARTAGSRGSRLVGLASALSCSLACLFCSFIGLN
jgi:hypothetical protein